MKILVKDSQSRIIRYGIKCFQFIDGIKCQAFAHATKKGDNLVIGDSFSDCVDIDGQSVTGMYKIISTGTGKVANVICEKIQLNNNKTKQP